MALPLYAGKLLACGSVAVVGVGGVVVCTQFPELLFETQKSRETSSGMKCVNNVCTPIENSTNINGLNGNHEVTKLSAEKSESSKYPNGFKYKVSTSTFTSEDGYYKLELPTGQNKWKLTKVDDLFSGWDKDVMSSGTWGATTETTSPTKIKVSVSTVTKTGSDPSSTFGWECEITPNQAIAAGKSLELSTQIGTMKTALGIPNSGSSTTTTDEVKKQRKIFVKNCANNRNDAQKKIVEKTSLGTDEKIQSTIKLKTEVKDESNQNQLQFSNLDHLWKKEIKSVSQ